jgi:hypothetical protein
MVLLTPTATVVSLYARISHQSSDVNRCRVCLRIWRCGGKNVVGSYGSTNALEFKLANCPKCDGIFDRQQDAGAN